MAAVQYFKALADETRLRLLNLACFQEFNVNELMAILGMGQSRISRHLKILGDSGLLRARRDGLWVFYRSVENGEGHRFIQAVTYLFRSHPQCRRDLQEAKNFLEAGRTASRKFFDALAPGWDELKRNILGSLDLKGAIIEQLASCRSLVDLGCGTGDLFAVLATKAQRVIGVDSSPKMLDQARRRHAGLDRKIQLRIGELEHLPLSNEEVEGVVINLVLHHLPDPAAGIREAWRVLRPGGRLVITDFKKHHDETLRRRYGDRWLGFSGRQMEGWLEGAGFSLLNRQEFPLERPSMKESLTVTLYVAIKS